MKQHLHRSHDSESFPVILHFRISNITMETAVEAGEGSEVSGDVARSIESCICPTGYTGLSCQVSLTWFLSSYLVLLTCSSSPAPPPFLLLLTCSSAVPLQDCAAGFFHQPVSELSSQRFLAVRPCVPCRCNNHSERCDAESGECQVTSTNANVNLTLLLPLLLLLLLLVLTTLPLRDSCLQDCQHHTSGGSCQRCAPGYHGNVSGSISDCSLCACPLTENR